MRTVRSLLYRDIGGSVLFVTVAFLALFYFIDVLDGLDRFGRGQATLAGVAWQALLQQPGHVVELLPITVLIGAVYSLARMAQSSEFTILRTAGLGPGRALMLLAVPGLLFAAITFVIGDYVAPHTERWLVESKVDGGAIGPGAWLKDRRDESSPQARTLAVNVQAMAAGGALRGIEIIEFDAANHLRLRMRARAGVVEDGHWRLQDVESTVWPTPAEAASGAPLSLSRHAALDWPTHLSRGVVGAALWPLQTMTTVDLWRYAHHLAGQDQDVQRHEIQFWKKAFYPFACLVMMALALPFAYLHARAGGISLKVFGGIMLGISFVLLNNAASHIGVLNGWTPWLAAAAPSLLYFALSMAAFAWLVRHR